MLFTKDSAMTQDITEFYRLLKKHIESLDKPLTFHKLQFSSGITSGQFSQFKKGKHQGGRAPSDMDLEKLSAVPELNLSIETLKGWRALDKIGVDAVREAYQTIHKDDKALTVRSEIFDQLPCLGYLTAEGLDTISTPEMIDYFEYFYTTQEKENLFCLFIRGNSLAPRFEDGGILLVKEADRFEDGLFYLVSFQNDEIPMQLFIFESGTPDRFHYLNQSKNQSKISKAIDANPIQKAYTVLEYSKNYASQTKVPSA
jgi:SOS-response transcriptional repressor LexA